MKKSLRQLRKEYWNRLQQWHDMLNTRKNVDSKTGKLTREHLDNCAGCSLCTE